MSFKQCVLPFRRPCIAFKRRLEKLIDREPSWTEFAELDQSNELGSYGGDQHKRLRMFLIKLAATCGEPPPCLVVADAVPNREDTAAFSGGYGDVYRGHSHGRSVAMKRLRPYNCRSRSQIRDLDEVRLPFIEIFCT